LAQHPQEFYLLDEVFDVLMHVGEPADGPARQMGGGGGQVLVFFIVCQGIGHGGGPHMGGRGRVCGHILDLLPLVIDLRFKALEAFHVFRSVFQFHGFSLILDSFIDPGPYIFENFILFSLVQNLMVKIIIDFQGLVFDGNILG
jgi:hypothetical protein